MQKRVCIIDFSGTEIRVGILIDDQLALLDFRLPWQIGFRQEINNRLIACFGQAFEQLDSNNPTEIRFTTLDRRLKDITDTKTLVCIFGAFLEEIFYQKLPEHGHPIEAMSIYVITPYQWKPLHRQQLRRAIKTIKIDSPIVEVTYPKLTLRGIFTQVLCLALHSHKLLTDICIDGNKYLLFMIDFTQNDIVIYQLLCLQSEDSITVDLLNILRFAHYGSDTKKQISEELNSSQKVGEQLPVVVGFSGKIDGAAETIIGNLKSDSNATFYEPQETATLLGAAEMVRQFETKKVEKPLHFAYNFCFGVQLPDGKWVELIPKTWVPPYENKKAFTLLGDLEKFYINLYCGLSVSDKSDVHRLATLEIDYPSDSNFTSHNPAEFILSVTLNDSTHGKFTVNFPHPQESRSVEFVVPVLMD